MSKNVYRHNMWHNMRMYDLTLALKTLTKLGIKKGERLVNYFQRLQEAPSTHFPYHFDEVEVIETRVSIICCDPKRKDFSNMLVDLALEFNLHTPLLVMDIFMSGAQALYLCMVTTDINKVFKQWVGLARPSRIHVFEIENDPKAITHLIMAPLSCFIYESDWLIEATKMTPKEQEFDERMRAEDSTEW